jgi:hypothetical protein
MKTNAVLYVAAAFVSSAGLVTDDWKVSSFSEGRDRITGPPSRDLRNNGRTAGISWLPRATQQVVPPTTLGLDNYTG